MAKEFTITLSGDDGFVSVDVLIEALENTLAVLRGLGSEFPGSDQIRWEIVRASMQSPLTLTLAPKAPERRSRKLGQRIADAAYRGFREIAERPSLPPYFNEEALTAAKRLVAGARAEKTELSFFVPDKDPVTPLAAFTENIEQVVSRAKTLYETGTIEGTLEVISRHKTDSVTIWETLTNRKVACFVNSEQLELAKQILLKRVAVSGRIKYRNGRPVSIEVANIRVLRGQHELPQPSDIGPIDITGGLSSEDYVRGLRDAQ